jgi:glycosyltransferase involved in cell wall biosynthesis
LKLCLVTDAWEPQTNGVVRTLNYVVKELEELGVKTVVIHPGLFKQCELPFYPDIKLALNTWNVATILAKEKPDFIHVATEGPLGLAARRYCIKKNLFFSTSFHTLFPEYLNGLIGLPLNITYAYLRWFHSKAHLTLVPTEYLASVLADKYGFKNLAVWGRGVNTEQFNPKHFDPTFLEGFPRPFYLYVGRVSLEKNIEAFCKTNVQGTKIIVGDGPLLRKLKLEYPNCVFLGKKTGAELSRIYASCNVFVFPSKTDTFGLVLLEAMASGLPVAAYPVPSPNQIVFHGITGCLDNDLEKAMLYASIVTKTDVLSAAKRRSWERVATKFLGYLKENTYG